MDILSPQTANPSLPAPAPAVRAGGGAGGLQVPEQSYLRSNTLNSDTSTARYGTPAPAYSSITPSRRDTPDGSSISRPSMSKSPTFPLTARDGLFPRGVSLEPSSRSRSPGVPYLSSSAVGDHSSQLHNPSPHVHWQQRNRSNMSSIELPPPAAVQSSGDRQEPRRQPSIPTRSPMREHHQHRRTQETRESWMPHGLSVRDSQRFSSMVEDCFAPSARFKETFDAASSNAVRQSAASGDLRRRRKPTFVESVMGTEYLLPQDLVANEGAVVDGGFYSMAPGMYERGSVLVDGPRRPSRFSTSTDSSIGSRRSSVQSFVSSMFGRPPQHQQHHHQQRQDSDDYLDEKAFPFGGQKPTTKTLHERRLSAGGNVRPPRLDLSKGGSNQQQSPRSSHRSAFKHTPKPSRLRQEFTSINMSPEAMAMPSDTPGWDDVNLKSSRDDAKNSNAPHMGKNERLASALGVVDVGDHHDGSHRRPDSLESKASYDSMEKSERDSTASSMRYTSHSSSTGPHGPHHTMSQADVIAICLMQGMVPPGLPSDPDLVTWSSPQSPTNPRNWSPFHKWYACVLVSLATFLANAGTNMLAPSLGLISQTWSEVYNPVKRGLLIGCYVFAFTFAPILFGPMSEILGRKPVILLGALFFLSESSLLANFACNALTLTGLASL